MSQELEGMYNSFVLRRVPQNWAFYGYLSLKPLDSWFDDFLKRIKFMNSWVTDGHLPCYWVSSFYFPQGFMTAVLQTYARKTMTPIDELVF
jgi:dynein heavy chain, axonemal